MYRIDNSTAAGTLPTPAAAGTPGYFTDGVAGTTAATVVPADFLNAVQEELANACTSYGQTLSKTNRNQLAAAIKAAVGGAFPVSFATISVSTTLTTASLGQFIQANGTGTTMTLPAAAASTGGSLGFISGSSGGFTLVSGGGSIIGSGFTVTSITIPNGAWICLQSNGTSWDIFSASPDVLGYTRTAGLGRMPPVYSRSAQGIVLPASYNGTQTVSFTAPVAGYILAFGSMNCSGTASVGIYGTLSINGTQIAQDNTLLSQSFMGIASVAAGATCTAAFNVTTTTNPSCAVSYQVAAIFLPYP